MKHLKKFDEHSAYSIYMEDDPVLPNVSYCLNLKHIHNTRKPNYEKQCLTFEALEDGLFSLTLPTDITTSLISYIEYSKDGGNSWTKTLNSSSKVIIVVSVNAGDQVMWRGEGKRFATSTYLNNTWSTFSSTCRYKISGNIMSLLGWIEDFTSANQHAFCRLFYDNSKLVSIKNLVMPAKTLQTSCYHTMFCNCTNLVECFDKLLAETLAQYCCEAMFRNTGLTEIVKLPVTTLATQCYAHMYRECPIVEVNNTLPATTLTTSCYTYMFAGCTQLTKAPELPATTLADSCYSNMFNGCTSLIAAPELPVTTLTDSCYAYMFEGCTSLTTPPVLSATTLAQNCYSFMFCNCTSLVNAPDLPATTLATGCYSYMFSGCKSLVTAPELPATTLVSSCYNYMFRICSNLNYIKAMFTTVPSTIYTNDWVKGVSTTGVFVKNGAATWDITGNMGVPDLWTIRTTEPVVIIDGDETGGSDPKTGTGGVSQKP